MEKIKAPNGFSLKKCNNIASLYGDGDHLAMGALAQRFNCSRQTISRAIKYAQSVAKNSGLVTAAPEVAAVDKTTGTSSVLSTRDQTIIRMRNEGRTIMSIAKHCECSRTTVRRVLKSNGAYSAVREIGVANPPTKLEEGEKSEPLHYMITPQCVVVVIGKKAHTIDKEHPNIKAITDALKNEKWDEVETLMDISASLPTYSNGRLEVKEGKIFFDGKEMRSTLTSNILKMVMEGKTVEPLANFMLNMMENSSKRVLDRIYEFLKYNSVEIDKTGCIIAYKVVTKDYTDTHTNEFDNSIGAIVSMPRNEVDDRDEVTCSSGLHVCALAYVSHFKGGEERLVQIRVNPRDIVSIPTDYSDAKVRCCEYTVLKDVTLDYENGNLVSEHIF